MKILQINVTGKSGSTGKIVTDIKNSLDAQGHKCIIVYGAGETVNMPGYMRICTEFERKINAACARATGVLYGYDLPFPFEKLKKFIEIEKPDIVHLHCANGYILNLFKTLEYLADKKIKTVITNHAEFYYTGGCGHAYDCNKWLSGCDGFCTEINSIVPCNPARYIWTHFKKAFDQFDNNNIFITSVSDWVSQRAKQSKALSRFRHQTVMNGLDTNIFKPVVPSPELKTRLPKNFVLHVTAQFTTKETNKGGNWICELARKLPDKQFVVASSYLGFIENLPENIILWGRTKDQTELAMLYSSAKVTVITSYRETFSMVTAESLCCGTPVVGFKAGGPETIALHEYTAFVEYGNVLQLKDKILEKIEKESNNVMISHEAQSIYSKETMASNYLNVYKSLLS